MKEYIEREAVLNDIAELFTLCHETLPNECGHHFIVEKELETHLEFVKELPAADVREVVRGTWKPVMTVGNPNIQERDEWYGSLFVCDKCNWTMIGESNFCPNCGADMRGEGDGT